MTSTIAFACLQCMFQRNLNLHIPKVHLFPVPNKYFPLFFNTPCNSLVLIEKFLRLLPLLRVFFIFGHQPKGIIWMVNGIF